MGQISVTAELERIGWPYSPSSEDHVKTRCPFHEDEHASCSFNVREGLFSCKAAGCGAAGDTLTFFARAIGVSRAGVYAQFAKLYDLEQVKAIEPSVVEEFHKAVWEAPHLRKELYLRGVTDSEIRKYRLGASPKGRVTIPIKNHSGVYVNIRYYLPGAPGADKMKNSRGRGDIRLYPVEQLEHEKIVLCGGEMKAIVAARVLNPHGVGAVTATGGEGNWHHSLTSWFKDKHVWVMMDVDEGGHKAARTYAALLSRVARWVGVVELPLDIDKYPHGDVNDFVASENGDLWSVVQSAPQWAPPTTTLRSDDTSEPMDTKFSETTRSDKVGRRMKFTAVVAATLPQPFVLPKQIVPTCDRSQDFCSLCAIFPKDDKVYHISAESPAILQMVGVSDVKLDSAIRGALGIPKRCGVVTFEVTDHFNAEDVRINPSLDICNRDTDRPMQHAICVDCEADLNTTYELVGRMYPHPDTQQATLLVAKSKTTADSLQRYVPQRLADLRVFRPAEWTIGSLRERLDDIYSDLEANVTKIYMRRDIHLFVDLAYHSVLLVTVDGKVTKGWVEVLVMGDSAQGKTEVAVSMMKHYGLGEKLECKNLTAAGLLGGLRQIGNEWYVSWGVMPTQDRRLVLLEELKGASREVIGKMTDMRSSGVAELSKIEKRRTHARTRLVANSNPRGERSMSSFSFGVEAVRDLIGAPEDVRRFDAALIVASSEIDPRALNTLVRDPPKVRHRYDADLCRELILWSWTRTVDQVKISDEASELVSEEASKLSEEYSDLIPLIDRGSTRHKLSRLATALACRTFSTGETEEHVRVRPCHVQYVVEMLRRVYSSRCFGYNNFSDAARSTDQMTDPDVIKNYMESLPFPNEIRGHLLYADEFDLVDVQDWCGWEREEAQRFLSLLVRKRAVKRRDRKYYKTSEFIAWLKDVELKERPDHLDSKETM